MGASCSDFFRGFQKFSDPLSSFRLSRTTTTSSTRPTTPSTVWPRPSSRATSLTRFPPRRSFTLAPFGSTVRSAAQLMPAYPLTYSHPYAGYNQLNSSVPFGG
mgnify:CR=1 FL=1|jgi:hypothetical protein